MSWFINSSPFRREYRSLEDGIEEVQSYHETFVFGINQGPWTRQQTLNWESRLCTMYLKIASKENLRIDG